MDWKTDVEWEEDRKVNQSAWKRKGKKEEEILEEKEAERERAGVLLYRHTVLPYMLLLK